ncbi:hypothetical protein L9F63_003448, partial [Diploptera punctata]
QLISTYSNIRPIYLIGYCIFGSTLLSTYILESIWVLFDIINILSPSIHTLHNDVLIFSLMNTYLKPNVSKKVWIILKLTEWSLYYQHMQIYETFKLMLIVKSIILIIVKKLKLVKNNSLVLLRCVYYEILSSKIVHRVGSAIANSPLQATSLKAGSSMNSSRNLKYYFSLNLKVRSYNIVIISLYTILFIIGDFKMIHMLIQVSMLMNFSLLCTHMQTT